MDSSRLTAQFNYLRKLKRLPVKKLRQLHQSKFKGTRYWVEIPRWVHRSVLENRLWYLYAIRNYHYPKGHALTTSFRKKAKAMLLVKVVPDMKEDMTQAQLSNEMLFTEESIDSMSDEDVDRYLISIGLYIDAEALEKKQALYEWHKSEYADLPDAAKKTTKRARFNNQHVLRKLVVENPAMTWYEFKDKFGDSMPTVTKNSFLNTRSKLRKAGYAMPALDKHPNALTRGGKKVDESQRVWSFLNDLNKD